MAKVKYVIDSSNEHYSHLRSSLVLQRKIVGVLALEDSRSRELCQDVFGFAISGGDVKVYSADGTLLASGISDSVGKTSFSRLLAGNYRIEIWFLGVKTSHSIYLSTSEQIDLGVPLE
jgi:hypothetical protein